MTALVDTNILVYRFDPRDARKQRIARDLLRSGIEHDALRLPHQAIVEFVQAATRPLKRGAPGLLSKQIALIEAESLLSQFTVLYPTDALVRLAVRGAATYQLGWFDAHLWAYAEHYGLTEILSEDFSDGQRIGTVRVRDPFASDADG